MTTYTVSNKPRLAPRPAQVARFLQQHGPTPAPTIAKRLRMTPNAVAGALHVLRRVGLLVTDGD